MTWASTPIESRMRFATFCEVANTAFASPNETSSRRRIASIVARSSGDSENCPSGVRSKS